jgi:hypothetical protein
MNSHAPRGTVFDDFTCNGRLGMAIASEYSRQSPSPRYCELIGQYTQMHVEGEKKLQLPPEQTFGGASLLRHVPRIGELVKQFGAGSLLDYGSGKGMQYRQGVKVSDGTTYKSVLDYWGVDSVTCFDPGFAPFNQLPAGKFDGVICTDVLEHCPEEDIRWIVGEMFSFARSFVFCNVACYAAQKHLPNGENAHCTVKSREWWRGLVGELSAPHPGVFYEITLSTPTTLADGRPAVEKECLRRAGA